MTYEGLLAIEEIASRLYRQDDSDEVLAALQAIWRLYYRLDKIPLPRELPAINRLAATMAALGLDRDPDWLDLRQMLERVFHQPGETT